MTPDIAESIRDTANLLNAYATDYLECHHTPPEDYAHRYSIAKPHDLTWVAFREHHLGDLDDAMKRQATRVYALATANVT